MVREARSRKESEADIYHVVSRGVGRQIIFEDDGDRKRYLDLLQREIAKHDGDILAWCLMDNHVHCLFRIKLADLSESMRAINSAYAMYFNKRHGRVGHLMQGRFKSEPIDSDEYLLTVVRYIHQNPEKANIAKTKRYPWSSYREYIEDASIVDSSHVLDLFDHNMTEFQRFHEIHDHSARCVDENRGRCVLDGESALQVAKSVIEPLRIEEVASLPKPQRDQLLCRLKRAGLSVRQIERLTGVSKSVVAKAKEGQ